jgi:hypothetical protein
MMPEPFQILTGFLDRFGDEVEGRALPEPPADLEVKVRELARGRLPESERARWFELLNQNPSWIARLADEIRALRAEPGADR